MLTATESTLVRPLTSSFEDVLIPTQPAPPLESFQSVDPSLLIESQNYVVRLAKTEKDKNETYRLRFLVFNLELNEGLQASYADGYDRDRYDDVCDHLIVEERSTGAIVGTYRVQMGDVAGRNFGYYSEQEFCFKPYEAMRSQIVELGRACIRRDHRSSEVLHLLWRAIARYSLRNGGRYMMGCCSLNSQDPEEGYAVYESLAQWMTEPSLQTTALEAYRITPRVSTLQIRPPKLLRAYLTIGAMICSTPAIDREFKTIDFLTICDLHKLQPRVAARFLEGS